jgi:hypothetical protein
MLPIDDEVPAVPQDLPLHKERFDSGRRLEQDA